MKKKTIPLNLLQVFEPVVQANLDVIAVRPYDNSHYYLVDAQGDSHFFFRVVADGSKMFAELKYGAIVIELNPKYDKSLGVKKHICPNLDALVGEFNEWLKRVRTYNTTLSVHDDNFFSTYFKHYYEGFKIVDSDAETSPFTPEQQERIEQALIEAAQVVEADEDLMQKGEGSSILSEIHEVQNTLSSSTKNEVMRKISSFCAKLFQKSKPTALLVWKKLVDKLLDKLIEGGIKFLPKAVEAIEQAG